VKITQTVRRGKLRLIILALIAAAVALIVPLSQSAFARTAAPSRGGGPKPTIVLEHGAWADSDSWDAVIQRLQADGYTVYAPPNPLQGLTYDSTYLADFLHSIKGPIVLVGHSYGGAVITNAATGDKQVKALVYVDAFAPAKGQAIAGLLAKVPGSCAAPANLNVVPFPGAPPVSETLTSSRACSRAAWPMACPAARPGTLPRPSGRSRRSRSARRPASRPGSPSHPGPSSAPPTTPSRPRCSWTWPVPLTLIPLRCEHRTCP
jgi:pimeloyl-ACP methyl ester carboxylesterase